MITVREITKTYGAFKAVDGISFDMKKGEVVGFLGPNGAGKTTTMRILTGFLPATEGTCEVAGWDISTHATEARRKIGYLPESNALYLDMEVTEYLEYMGSLQGLSGDRLQKGLGSVVGTCGLGKVLGKKIGTLSKGYRQRVGLAQALIHSPEILILDEPTVGLDPNQIGEIRQLIKDIGRDHTVLLSTHILSEVEQTCERVIIIADGKIVGQGTPQELMNQSHGASIYYVSIRAPQEALGPVFKNLSGFVGIDIIRNEGDLHQIRLVSNNPDDQSEWIFRMIVEQRWSLTELRKEKRSMEAVFKELTQ